MKTFNLDSLLDAAEAQLQIDTIKPKNKRIDLSMLIFRDDVSDRLDLLFVNVASILENKLSSASKEHSDLSSNLPSAEGVKRASLSATIRVKELYMIKLAATLYDLYRKDGKTDDELISSEDLNFLKRLFPQLSENIASQALVSSPKGEFIVSSESSINDIRAALANNLKVVVPTPNGDEISYEIEKIGETFKTKIKRDVLLELSTNLFENEIGIDAVIADCISDMGAELESLGLTEQNEEDSLAVASAVDSYIEQNSSKNEEKTFDLEAELNDLLIVKEGPSEALHADPIIDTSLGQKIPVILNTDSDAKDFGELNIRDIISKNKSVTIKTDGNSDILEYSLRQAHGLGWVIDIKTVTNAETINFTKAGNRDDGGWDLNEAIDIATDLAVKANNGKQFLKELDLVSKPTATGNVDVHASIDPGTETHTVEPVVAPQLDSDIPNVEGSSAIVTSNIELEELSIPDFYVDGMRLLTKEAIVLPVFPKMGKRINNNIAKYKDWLYEIASSVMVSDDLTVADTLGLDSAEKLNSTAHKKINLILFGHEDGANQSHVAPTKDEIVALERQKKEKERIDKLNEFRASVSPEAKARAEAERAELQQIVAPINQALKSLSFGGVDALPGIIEIAEKAKVEKSLDAALNKKPSFNEEITHQVQSSELSQGDIVLDKHYAVVSGGEIVAAGKGGLLQIKTIEQIADQTNGFIIWSKEPINIGGTLEDALKIKPKASANQVQTPRAVEQHSMDSVSGEERTDIVPKSLIEQTLNRARRALGFERTAQASIKSIEGDEKEVITPVSTVVNQKSLKSLSENQKAMVNNIINKLPAKLEVLMETSNDYEQHLYGIVVGQLLNKESGEAKWFIIKKDGISVNVKNVDEIEKIYTHSNLDSIFESKGFKFEKDKHDLIMNGSRLQRQPSSGMRLN